MSRDTTRQIINVIATIGTILLNVFSTNVFGRSVGEISSRHPVPVTPAGYAFAIWGIIYIGLIVFAIYQSLPAQRENPQLRRIGYWYALSCVANVAWEYVWLNEWINLSLLMMGILLLALLIIYIRANINKENTSPLESWCVNAPFGLYLGWITVASIVNTAVVLANLGWNGFGISPAIWTAILLVVGTGIAVYVGLTCVDIVYLVVIVWAYIAIFIRNSGNPIITTTAGAMVAIILITMLMIGLWRDALLRHAQGPIYS